MPSPERGRGFTLVELLVVLALLGMVAAMVVPALSGNESRQFRTQVSQVVSILNYARRIAIVRSMPGIAELSVTGQPQLMAQLDEEEEAPRPNRVRWQGEPGLRLAYQPGLDQVAEPVQKLEVSFYPQGGSSGGIIHLQHNQLRARVRVDPITGRISASFFDEDFND